MREVSCRAAVYIRLSVEDTKSGSISIETQRMMIGRFLARHPEIAVYNTYIDNGATNFRRPGFQQMLSDIEAGEANCVIVPLPPGAQHHRHGPLHRAVFLCAEGALHRRQRSV